MSPTSYQTAPPRISRRRIIGIDLRRVNDTNPNRRTARLLSFSGWRVLRARRVSYQRSPFGQPMRLVDLTVLLGASGRLQQVTFRFFAHVSGDRVLRREAERFLKIRERAFTRWRDDQPLLHQLIGANQ